MTIQESIAKTKRILQDTAEILSDPEIELFTVQALPMHSKKSPRDFILDITGDDGFDYDLESGAETLTNEAFDPVTGWDVTGDFAIAVGSVTYTHNTGVGTLTQTGGNLNTAGVGDSDYVLVLTISAVTDGAVLVLTNAFSKEEFNIDIKPGTFTYEFVSQFTTGNFVLSVTSGSAGIFTIEELSVKRRLGWEDGFSVIKKIEFPAGERTPLILDDKSWEIYDNGVNKSLRLLDQTPSTTETIRLTITKSYDAETFDSLPKIELEIFPIAVASLCAAAIARHYAQNTDPTVDADAVDYGGNTEKWNTKANELWKQYLNEIVGDESVVKAASVTMEWDIKHPWGDDFLTHRSSWR